MAFLSEIFTSNSNPYMLLFFAVFLSICLPALHFVASLRIMETTNLRKLFHGLAVLIFVPPMVTSTYSGPSASRFCVFSLNCASVALIALEMVRAVPVIESISTPLNTYFRTYVDRKERAATSLILSHIYLLLGCAFPMTMSYIVLDGGFFNGEFGVFALSGVVVLGVGDSAAAVMGKISGVNYWQDSKYSKKT
jgi:dolichol kinase